MNMNDMQTPASQQIPADWRMLGGRRGPSGASGVIDVGRAESRQTPGDSLKLNSQRVPVIS